MINFRFHLVSLVAVFLALTIGIVVGASVVNQQIVDGLNRRINTVENNADKQRSENLLLSGKVKELESYLTTAAPYVVESRLTAVPVVVVAEHGVDRDATRALVTLLQDAGAETPAIVWLQSKWLLDKPDDRTALAGIVGSEAGSSGLRVQAVKALAAPTWDRGVGLVGGCVVDDNDNGEIDDTRRPARRDDKRRLRLDRSVRTERDDRLVDLPAGGRARRARQR